MVLGIQKLSSASGPVDFPLPENFQSGGLNIPADRVLFYTLPSWPDSGGSLVEGPLQNSDAIQDAPTFRWLRGTPMPWQIGFWIRVPQGGGGLVFALSNPGYLFLGANNTDLFTLGVTETNIQLEDNLGYTLSTDIDLNKENPGWHHIWITYERKDTSPSQALYVDGRNIGWQNSTYNGPGGNPSGDGYGEFSIGGRRVSTQVGTDQVITYASLANEFDICHFGIWTQSLAGVYAAYDPGTLGKLEGTYQQGTNPNPYPSIWCELDHATGNGKTIRGYSLEGSGQTFDPTIDPSLIFDASGGMGEAGLVGGLAAGYFTTHQPRDTAFSADLLISESSFTTTAKYGSHSLQSDYISGAPNTINTVKIYPRDRNFYLNSDHDWTIEFWAYTPDQEFNDVGDLMVLATVDDVSLSAGRTNTPRLEIAEPGSPDAWRAIGAGGAEDGRVNLTSGQWLHFAMVSDNGEFRWYINGNEQEPLDPNNQTYSNTSLHRSFCFGMYDTQTITNFSGGIHYDDIRISNIVRYGGNFTPPTAALTTDVNTIALFDLNNDLRDSSQ